jgi:hypothetical protein
LAECTSIRDVAFLIRLRVRDPVPSVEVLGTADIQPLADVGNALLFITSQFIGSLARSTAYA